MTSLRARRLRRQSTEAEKILWRALRDRQLAGRKFRRQQPIGPYVVDFICPELRLVIEVDSGQHATDGPERTRWLEGAGYRVIRFWNNDVLGNLDGVLQTLDAALISQD